MSLSFLAATTPDYLHYCIVNSNQMQQSIGNYDVVVDELVNTDCLLNGMKILLYW